MSSLPINEAIQSYVDKTAAFYKELATVPLLPSSSCASSSVPCYQNPPSTFSNITVATLAETVSNLSLRVSRMESMLYSLQGTQHNREYLQAHSTFQQGMLHESLAPMKVALHEHQRMILDMACVLNGLSQHSPHSSSPSPAHMMEHELQRKRHQTDLQKRIDRLKEMSLEMRGEGDSLLGKGGGNAPQEGVLSQPPIKYMSTSESSVTMEPVSVVDDGESTQRFRTLMDVSHPPPKILPDSVMHGVEGETDVSTSTSNGANHHRPIFSQVREVMKPTRGENLYTSDSSPDGYYGSSPMGLPPIMDESGEPSQNSSKQFEGLLSKFRT